MKILTISNLFPPYYLGGYELLCRVVTEGMRCRGHEVHVLTSTYGLDKAAPNAALEPGVERSLKVHGMFGFPWLPIQKLKEQEYHNNKILRQKIARLQPDLIYLFNMGGLSKSMLWTIRDSGVPTAYFISDHWLARSENADVWLSWWNRENTRLPHRMLRWLLSATGIRKKIDQQAPTHPLKEYKFRGVYFPSKFLRDFTINKGYNVVNPNVIPCPVNIEKFDGLVKPAAQPIEKLLYVGRVTADKGVMTAARAMALLRDKFAGKLAVYGRGDQEQELRDYAAKEKLPIEIHTNAEPKHMPEIYRNHDALLFTSEWEEPFALTPLEGMASGLAVIGTTTGGSGELFRNGENSLTYQAGKAEDLARQILALDKNPILREKLATAGQREAREVYSEPIILDRIESHLIEAAAGKKAAELVYAG